MKKKGGTFCPSFEIGCIHFRRGKEARYCIWRLHRLAQEFRHTASDVGTARFIDYLIRTYLIRHTE